MLARRTWRTAARVGAAAVLVGALAVAGCAGPREQAGAPASTTAGGEASAAATREASAPASLSASDAALLKAVESTSDPTDELIDRVERRAEQLADELVAAPFVAESTITLPGARESDPGRVGDHSPNQVMIGFNIALRKLGPAEYFAATGLRATPAQLRELRVALLGRGAQYPGWAGRLQSPQGAALQRCLAQRDGSGDLTVYWTRTEKRGKNWVIVAVGRDGSWKSEPYAGRLWAYLRLTEWTDSHMTYEKPAIYLYPSREQSVTVLLGYRGVLTSTAPVIDSAAHGWTVKAKPNGALTDAAGRRWPYLFWEGAGSQRFDLSTGSVVRGTQVDAFLRAALGERGLNASESGEFRAYWVPRLSASPWVLIHFEGVAYERYAPLAVTPKPDVSLRVFMVARPLEQPVTVRPQRPPSAPTRRGFTLVEWGGALMP